MFAGFDTTGCRRIQVVAYTVGHATPADLAECTVVIEFEDHQEEVTVPYPEGERPNLAGFLAGVEALNRFLEP